MIYSIKLCPLATFLILDYKNKPKSQTDFKPPKVNHKKFNINLISKLLPKSKSLLINPNTKILNPLNIVQTPSSYPNSQLHIKSSIMSRLLITGPPCVGKSTMSTL